jgi:hypothetical protein
LGAVERLDLRLLVDRQRQRMLGRIDIEADDILHLGGKLRIVRQFERAHPVRLEAMRRPDALHAAMADPGGFRHRPAGPVRRLARRLSERHLDHSLDRPRRQRRLARWAGGLMQQAVNAFGHKARLPAPNRRLAFVPVCRWIAIVPSPSALSSTIRACHTCFCGLFPDPITASSRSRSPGPSRTSTPFLILTDSHIRKPAGIVRQRQTTSRC